MTVTPPPPVPHPSLPRDRAQARAAARAAACAGGTTGPQGADGARGAQGSAGARPRVERLRVRTEDPAEGLAVLEQVYTAGQMQVCEDVPFRLQQEVRSAADVSLERARLGGVMATARIDATGTVRVAQLLGGRLVFTDGTPTRPTPAPFLLPVRPYTCRWDDLDLRTVTLDLERLQDLAAGLLGTERFRLRFAGSAPVSAGMARYWNAAVAHFRQVQLEHDEAMAAPLLRDQAFRSLATTLLHAFPSTFLEDEPAPATASRPAPAGVRRAVAFMEAHLAEPIGLPEIAEAARLSPRGLQVAFRRELGTTPLAHLRALRLEAAHADLRAADPADGQTVTGIAARWGFGHTGRFAAAYRQRYGVAPAETLRD